MAAAGGKDRGGCGGIQLGRHPGPLRPRDEYTLFFPPSDSSNLIWAGTSPGEPSRIPAGQVQSPSVPTAAWTCPRRGPGPTATWQTGPGAAALPRPPSYLLSVSRDLEEVGLLPLMPTQCQAPQSGPAREPWGRPSCGADASAAPTRQLWDPGQLLLHRPSAHPLWKPGSCGLNKPSTPLPGREALDTRRTCWAMAAARGEQELILLRARRGSAFSLGVCHREAKLRLRKGG